LFSRFRRRNQLAARRHGWARDTGKEPARHWTYHCWYEALSNNRRDYQEIRAGEIGIGVKSLQLSRSHFANSSAQEACKQRRRNVTTLRRRSRRSRQVCTSVSFGEAARDFLNGVDFRKQNIPVLEATAGGADANPLWRWLLAGRSIKVSALVSELPKTALWWLVLKKSTINGARFPWPRNYSDGHLPERAPWSGITGVCWLASGGMDFTEKMIRRIVDGHWGTRRLRYWWYTKVDFGSDDEHFCADPVCQCTERTVRYYDVFFLVDWRYCGGSLKTHGLEVEKQDNRQRSLDRIMENAKGKTLAGGLSVDMPTLCSHSQSPSKPWTHWRVQSCVFGWGEMCRKAFLNWMTQSINIAVFSKQQNELKEMTKLQWWTWVLARRSEDTPCRLWSWLFQGRIFLISSRGNGGEGACFSSTSRRGLFPTTKRNLSRYKELQ